MSGIDKIMHFNGENGCELIQWAQPTEYLCSSRMLVMKVAGQEISLKVSDFLLHDSSGVWMVGRIGK